MIRCSLIALLTWWLMNDSVSSTDICFTSLDTQRVLLDEMCLPSLALYELSGETVGYQLGRHVGFPAECDTFIIFRLLGFAVNSFDGPRQLSDVGPVVYALNECSPLSSLVIRCCV